MDLVEDLNQTASGWPSPYSDLLERAAKEIVRLNLDLQKRDKCSYIGPMRDCPTHGEGSELKALRSLCRQLYEAELTKNQQDWTAVIRALEKVGAGETELKGPNGGVQAPCAASRARSPGTKC